MNRALPLLACLLPGMLLAQSTSEQLWQRALAQGQVRPFNEVMQQARALPGQLLKVDLLERDGCWVYELKLLDQTRNIIKVGYRADSLRMIYLKGHHLEDLFMRPPLPEEEE